MMNLYTCVAVVTAKVVTENRRKTWPPNEGVARCRFGITGVVPIVLALEQNYAAVLTTDAQYRKALMSVQISEASAEADSTKQMHCVMIKKDARTRRSAVITSTGSRKTTRPCRSKAKREREDVGRHPPNARHPHGSRCYIKNFNDLLV